MSLKSITEAVERVLARHLAAHRWQLSWEPMQLTEHRFVGIATATRADQSHKLALVACALEPAQVRAVEDRSPEVIIASQISTEYLPGANLRVIAADELVALICEWNERIDADGLMRDGLDPMPTTRREVLHVRAESPLDEIWDRLGQFSSVALSRQLLARRRRVHPTDIAGEHADALAYFIRNARDYFTASTGQNVTQRALSLYYGTMALAEAEIIAHPNGPTSIADIEAVTRFGHGLGSSDLNLASPTLAALCVFPMRNGFFHKWMSVVGHDVSAFHQRRPERPTAPFATLLEVAARIPELGPLYADVTPAPPQFAVGYQAVNKGGDQGSFRGPTFTYVDFADESGRLTLDIVRSFGGLNQLQYAESHYPGRVIRALVRHPENAYWWDTLPVHQSGTVRHTLIAPLWGSIREYRVLCTVLLYALSIVVRYRPSLWRQTQEGALDHLKNLVDAFLRTVQRLMPEHFLAALIDRPVHAGAPATFF